MARGWREGGERVARGWREGGENIAIINKSLFISGTKGRNLVRKVRLSFMLNYCWLS